MFRRRVPLSFSQRMRHQVWPAMGLRRTSKYLWVRLHRIPDSPSAIAAGAAIGFMTAMTPLLGTHLILAVGIAWLMRANIVAAIAGSWIINPWTAPPIWLATYYVGRHMEGASADGHTPSFVTMFKGMTEAVLNTDARLFAADVWPILKPMLLGAIPLGFLGGLLIYFGLRHVLTGLRAKRTALLMTAATRPTYDKTQYEIDKTG